MAALAVKRVYEPVADSDGQRVLVDRLWPRGLGKDKARVDLWLKEAAPSPELRKWFGHRHARWAAFRRKYQDELAQRPDILRLLKDLHRRSTVTLLFATRDTTKNHAVVLRDLLERKRTRSSR